MHLKRYIQYSFYAIKQWANIVPKIKILTKEYSTKVRSPVTDQFIVRSPYNNISIPNETISELIWKRHSKWSNHKAVVCGLTGEEYTYSQLKESSMIIGKSLINEGLCSGDVLALMLPNCPQFISILLGASERGITICSINPLYTEDEITQHIKSSGAKKIVTVPDKVQDVMKAIENLKVAKCLPPNFKIYCIKVPWKNNASIPKGTVSLNDLVNRINITNMSKNTSAKISEDSLALIAHSSGTTGLPKGVPLTQKNVMSAVLQMSEEPVTIFKKTNGDHQDIVPMVSPMSHNFALITSLAALYHGSKIVTLPNFEPKAYLTTLKDYKATLLLAVPPTVLFLASNPSVTEEHLENARCLFTAAAPIGTEDINRFLKKAPKDINIVKAYGLTESTCLTTQIPYGHKDYTSVGVPLANIEMKVIDLQTKESKRAQEEGEICFRGPQMTTGYLNNPQANKETIDDDGWFHTGDIGYYDKDGFFYVVDRKKELIKVKGFQVAPAELEHALRRHPGIDSAGVIGVPDVIKGEVPVGFIKKKKGSAVTESNIKEFLATKVAAYKQIEKYIFVDSIPTNPSGKILKRELRIMYQQLK